MNDKRIVEVVGAIINGDVRYHVGQRVTNKVQGGLREFMSGMFAPREAPKQALTRECHEESFLVIGNEMTIYSFTHAHHWKAIPLAFISCAPKKGAAPTALEHRKVRWVTRHTMNPYHFALPMPLEPKCFSPEEPNEV